MMSLQNGTHHKDLGHVVRCWRFERLKSGYIKDYKVANLDSGLTF
jgi:hypothetical protein